MKLTKRAVAGVAPITFVDTQVFSGTSPAYPNWTDLDLSSVIGVKQALVYLRCYLGAAAAGSYFHFRENGETKDAQTEACSGSWAVNDGVTYLWVLTDANGVVEWTGDLANVGCTIRVRAYIVAS